MIDDRNEENGKRAEREEFQLVINANVCSLSVPNCTGISCRLCERNKCNLSKDECLSRMVGKDAARREYK